MSNAQAEKMKLSSMDIAEEKRAQLKQLLQGLLPEAVNESGIDFEQLKRALGEWAEPGKERFGLQWPGKAECMKIVQQPSVATLKPARDESVNFDESENLFIEGDNLEVLKLLQKSYFGKIKMIYIDPPYNTGSEFIYPDRFAENLDTYLAYTGQTDNAGKKFSTNTENDGRYHSRWLNMMYPRLYLARNLLSQDGIIFISIDDNESANLQKLCNEIFGEENFIAVFPWRKRTAKSDVPFGISQDYEWVIAYAAGDFAAGKITERKYYKTDDHKERWRLSDLTKQSSKTERPKSYFTMVNPKNGEQYPANPNRVWAVSEDTFPDYYKRGKIVFPGDYDFLSISKPAYRVFESEDKAKNLNKFGSEETRRAISTMFPPEVGRTEDGTKEITDLFGSKVFPFPKPTSLIKHLINTTTENDFIILDFFAGSATTAHAAMLLNAEDGGSRKYICVQLPEPCDENSEQNSMGYKTIADISKDRIKRAAKKIAGERKKQLDLNGGESLDLGFRVFKLDRSNFKVWEGAVEQATELEKQLSLHVDHIAKASTPEDILYELLLKAGFSLTTKVEKVKMAGKEVFSIHEGALLICLEKELTQQLIDALAEANPVQVICLDEGFNGNDQLKANAVQTFKARAQAEESEIVFKTV